MVTVRTRRATLTVLLIACGVSAAAQSPRPTELLLDSVPADSVKCGGLTVQFARFFKEHIQVLHIYNVPAIDIWVWNRTDSVHTYDPKMLAAVNESGQQIAFLSPADVGHSFGDFTSSGVRDVVGRTDYAAGPVLPHVSLGRNRPRCVVSTAHYVANPA